MMVISSFKDNIMPQHFSNSFLFESHFDVHVLPLLFLSSLKDTILSK
ncbi:putative chlorophyll(ide) b reductase NYC1, chloroplastic [Iris pallida]|uniref:Chlorophyll(Ide) b reductase NYC1, chloroplastic n=1 Tax=Iris pallida TaxID=29817 RepID=A0AAX6FAY9_IRIPA|nr:putative chlorophyll(ide) b reductase NYC1, chloroplastic [Iris pallida]